MSKQQFLNLVAFKLGQELAKAAPRDTSRLARSFQGATKIQGDKIVFSVPYYAEYIEFGTQGPYEIKPKNKKALKFNVGGTEVITKKVIHPGLRPNPFIRDTLKRKLPQIIKSSMNVYNK